MKKTLKAIALGILAGQMAFAGGIVTNTNQSAQWVRMMSRDASTDIDAVYYNPAGVTTLGQGLHLSLSNQSVFQEYTISNDFTGLRSDVYTGEVSAPLFPNVYASYNTEKWALSLGFGPVGGGGSAEYANGLPDFDLLLLQQGIPAGYEANINFSGSSIYYGTQLNFAYKINEMLSASIGGRLVIAKNHYEGAIKEVMYGGNDLGLAINVDADQSAVGITPIIGLNITPSEKINIGLKWEGNTSLELENSTKVDDVGLFPDGAKTNRDMPMMFSAGAQYKATDNLRIQLGYHLFMDKNADWSGNEDLVDDNFYEVSLGAEYDISELLTVSAGIQKGTTGVSEAYQDNTSFSLSSSTIGVGAVLNLNEQLSIDLGFSRMLYEDMDDTTATPVYKTNYDKDGYMLAIGISYSIF